MSAPSPYETNPLRPPSSVHILYFYEFRYICKRFLSYFFHMVFTLCPGKVCICHLRMRSKILSHLEAVLSSIWYMLVRVGTKYMTVSLCVL